MFTYCDRSCNRTASVDIFSFTSGLSGGMSARCRGVKWWFRGVRCSWSLFSSFPIGPSSSEDQLWGRLGARTSSSVTTPPGVTCTQLPVEVVQRLDEEHGAAPWTTSTESCVHVTPGGVATEEDVRAPRRPHNWSSELLWPYWKATEERPTTPHSPKPPLHASTPS